jgi:hypothetical protein
LLLDGKLDDDERDPESPKSPTRGWFIGLAISVMPIYIAFALFGQSGRGTAAACMVVSVVLAVRFHWELWSKTWFWISTVLISLLHVLLLFTIRWPDTQFRAKGIAFVGTCDCLIVYFLFALLGRFTKGLSTDAKTGGSDSDDDDSAKS